VRVTEIEQGTRLEHGQIDNVAFGDLVEIHVAAVRTVGATRLAGLFDALEARAVAGDTPGSFDLADLDAEAGAASTGIRAVLARETAFPAAS
jgi:hypothetical protein